MPKYNIGPVFLKSEIQIKTQHKDFTIYIYMYFICIRRNWICKVYRFMPGKNQMTDKKS